MSAQKQQRLIKQKPDVIIATPGRLWELMSDVCIIEINYFLKIF